MSSTGRMITMPAEAANQTSKAIGQEKEKMSKPEFIVTPGFGERFRQALHFSTSCQGRESGGDVRTGRLE